MFQNLTQFRLEHILRPCYKKVKFGWKQEQIQQLCSSLRPLRICYSLPACFSTYKNGRRYKTLTEIERERIVVFHKENLFTRVIASKFGHGKTVIANFLKDPDAYGTKK